MQCSYWTTLSCKYKVQVTWHEQHYNSVANKIYTSGTEETFGKNFFDFLSKYAKKTCCGFKTKYCIHCWCSPDIHQCKHLPTKHILGTENQKKEDKHYASIKICYWVNYFSSQKIEWCCLYWVLNILLECLRSKHWQFGSAKTWKERWTDIAFESTKIIHIECTVGMFKE